MLSLSIYAMIPCVAMARLFSLRDCRDQPGAGRLAGLPKGLHPGYEPILHVGTRLRPASVAALIAIFFFMSIMFPTIVELGVADLGAQSKIAASFLIMSIVGGALAPYLMGLIADARGSGLAYLIP